MAHYIDTSALTKLVVVEAETDALRAWFASREREPVSSDLARTELLRTVRRAAPDRLLQARDVLEALTLLELTTEIFEQAGRLDPAILRTLDAVHLAAALDLGDDLDGVVTYDDRLAAAAIQHGVRVVAPR